MTTSTEMIQVQGGAEEASWCCSWRLPAVSGHVRRPGRFLRVREAGEPLDVSLVLSACRPAAGGGGGAGGGAGGAGGGGGGGFADLYVRHLQLLRSRD